MLWKVMRKLCELFVEIEHESNSSILTFLNVVNSKITNFRQFLKKRYINLGTARVRITATE